MLVLKYQDETIADVVEGSSFSLPNGDIVSPAMLGWSNDAGYHLEQSAGVVPLTETEMLQIEREGMELTFAQLLIGLVSEGWITVAEGEAWLQGILPPLATDFISTLPQQYQFIARARLIRPSVILRLDSSTLGLATTVGTTDEEIDTFFRTYC